MDPSPSKEAPEVLIISLQIGSDFGKLGEGGLEVFDDFGGDDVGIGKVGRLTR
jgi:hypothetical protein